MSKIRRSIAIALAGLAVLVPAGLAGAQEDPYVGPSPTVENATTVAPSATVAGAAEEAPAAEVKGSSLAFTGSDAAGLAVIGALAVALGGLALWTRNRRNALTS